MVNRIFNKVKWLVLMSPCLILAQNDVILKTNGEEMQGKVIAMNPDDLQFVYSNETVEYSVPKSEILKITFASGRVEFFNKDMEKHKASLEDHHNKVAVLPFGYIRDQERSNPMMQQQIQDETYRIFSSKAITLQFQDPKTTNALLAKAGINNDNIDGFTMGEIADILSVEYLIQGMVSVEATTVTNISNTTTTNKSTKSDNARVDKNGNIIGDIWNTNKGTTKTSSYGTQTQNYATNIAMNIYTDKGDNVFSNDHQAFWQTQDAYKITLNYLAKRTPLFKR